VIDVPAELSVIQCFWPAHHKIRSNMEQLNTAEVDVTRLRNKHVLITGGASGRLESVEHSFKHCTHIMQALDWPLQSLGQKLEHS
jgi:hypothetical protein